MQRSRGTLYNPAMQNADLLLKQLSENSRAYRDPLAAIDWPRLAEDGCWLPEPALSLHGLAEYDTLAEGVKRRLSQYEFINTMCCGLWLESLFLRRLSRRLTAAPARAEREYFLHELREETGHSLMFLRAIEGSGLPLPEDAWRPPPLADIVARRAPAGGVLFWAAVVIGEDIPDKFNRYVRAHAGTVNPAVAQICTLHAVDEARHIAAARAKLESALARAAPLRVALLAPLVKRIFAQLVETFYLPPAVFYELAGLTRGRWWRAMAARNPARRRFIAQCVAPTARMMQGYGLPVAGRGLEI
jgi:hypothetical protein